MADIKIKRALIAVYDKTGVAEFARALVQEFGIEIISTGGTARHLKEAGVPVTMVEEVTGFPEMLDGRVKTLHPKIHAGILADRDNPEHMRQLAEQGIQPIDMVVVNLYPFEKTIAKPDCTFEEAIEMIDIGGPCLLRAAAKNHRHVLVESRSDLYKQVLAALRRWDDEVERSDALASGAYGAFVATAAYEASVATWFSRDDAGQPRLKFLRMRDWGKLRYGENPHQVAELLQMVDETATFDLTAADCCADQDDAQGQFSHNNFLDASAALDLCTELTRAGQSVLHQEANTLENEGLGTRVHPAVCFIKHTNACGASVHADPAEAYRRAYLGDPNAAMGGILAVNFEVTVPFAEAVMETYQRWGKAAGAGGFFVEVWLAPSFEDKCIDVIRTRKDWGKRVRLLELGFMSKPPDPSEKDFKRIAGGMLMQSRDLIGLNEDQWKVVTKRQPTAEEMDDLRLAWLVCKHTKSNAITICKDGMLIGNGAGQMSRVMSCRIATWLAKENGHADKLAGAVAASDAFFPFRDGPDILMEAGVTALIQPGGSKRDEDTIKACDEHGVAMIFTGTRHFKH